MGCDNLGWGTSTLPCFGDGTLHLQGSRFFCLGLTALPVDYKAHGRKQNTPSSVPPGHVSSVLGQRHWWPAPTPEKNKCMILNSLFPVKETANVEGSASVLQLHWGMYCLAAPALQSPCSRTPCGFIYMYFHSSFLYVTAALGWQLVTKGYRFHGHQVRCHHTKQSQFHELPMICIAEVTFYPGCAIAVI